MIIYALSTFKFFPTEVQFSIQVLCAIGSLMQKYIFTLLINMRIRPILCYLWCDSKIVLSGIPAPSSEWSIFMAQRSIKIQKITKGLSMERAAC